MAWRGLLLLVVLLVAGCAESAPREDPVQQTEEYVLAGVVVTEAIVPIEGAAVVVDAHDLNTTTDARGRFQLGPVEAGTYELSIEADGYADASVVTTATRPEGELTKVVLVATGTDVPYHELSQYTGYLECTFDSWVAPYQILGAPCIGLIDLVAGVNVSTDRWQFPFEVASPGLEGIQIEMIWDEQPTGSWMGLLLRNIAGAGSGVDAGGTNIDTQYFSNRSESPMIVRVYQGIENPGADDGALFQDPQNETAWYKILILGRADYSQVADIHLMLQYEPQIFLTKFYNAMGDESYAVVQ